MSRDGKDGEENRAGTPGRGSQDSCRRQHRPKQGLIRCTSQLRRRVRKRKFGATCLFSQTRPGAGGKSTGPGSNSPQGIFMKRILTSTITITASMVFLFVTSAPRAMADVECGTDQSQPVLPRNGSSVSGRGTL